MGTQQVFALRERHMGRQPGQGFQAVNPDTRVHQDNGARRHGVMGGGGRHDLS